MADSGYIELKGVEVRSTQLASPIRSDFDGSIHLNSAGANLMPQFLGNADPIHALQALPIVRTNNDMGGGLNVQGCGLAQNHISINGHQVINPMHMLGLFSVFNTPHFSDYTLIPVICTASSPNAIGAIVEARTSNYACESLKLDACVGLFESHTTIGIPVCKGRSSLTVSGRLTYLDLLFPNVLKINHAALTYRFYDFNATYIHELGNDWKLKADIFYGDDNVNLDDKIYDSRFTMRWSNFVSGISLQHPKWEHRLSCSALSNGFNVEQNAMFTQLPSSIASLEYAGTCHFGNALVGVSVTGRDMEQQHNRDITMPHAHSLEASASVDYARSYGSKCSVSAGLKLTAYAASGFARLYPMPRLSARYAVSHRWSLSAQGGLYVQAVHNIRESDVGLPTDFYLLADGRFRPLTAIGGSVKAEGSMPHNLQLSAEAYYRRLCNVTEYNGAILNFLNSQYDPLADVLVGDGYSWGVAATLTLAMPKLKGWIGYNVGQSKSRFEKFGSSFLPAALDRLHDLNLTLSWLPTPRLTVSAMMSYASGTPYTKAAYGYIIGDNLVCEYFPHNSSRLPDYKRCDVSVEWVLSHKHGIRQALQLSACNIFAWRNVLFQYSIYTLDKGITHKLAYSDYLLPSINYSIRF